MDGANLRAPHARGDKRGSWATFRRRLVLVRRLLRGPADGDALVHAAEQEQGAEAYPASAALALKHDLQALRVEFGCQIAFQRRTQSYVLEGLGDLALLDLPDECLEALALLDATFPANAPLGIHQNVRRLLAHFVAMLPSSRRQMLTQHMHLPRLLWPVTYDEQVHPRTLDVLQFALFHQRQVVFDYRSNYDTDGQARSYQVGPYQLYVRDGHTYLDATVLRAPANMSHLHLRAIQFRLDRMLPGSVRSLFDPLPEQRPPQPVYRLVYELGPAVARNRDVGHWFSGTSVQYFEDGRALVTGQTSDLWQARQVLMRYMEHCLVLEPLELVSMMRQTALAMVAVYTASSDETALR